MPRHFPTLLAAALLAASLPVVHAQMQQPAPSDPGRISLDVVVAPKSGKPVDGLTQQDFTVLDNNVPRPITSFSAPGSAHGPVEITLVIDAVNTNYIDIAREREQVDSFLKSNDGHLSHPITIAIFTDSGTQIQQTSSQDGNQLSQELDSATIGLRDIRRDSQFEASDRFNLSLRALESLVAHQAARPGRKLIFWISPGWPLLSGPRVDLDAKQQQQIYSQIVALSTTMRRSNVTLYSIDPLGAGQSVAWQYAYEPYLKGVDKPAKVDLGDLSLQVVATQSGGLALTASNDTASQIERALRDADAAYHITYDAPPPEKPTEYHHIEVKVNQSGLTARTRTGYYTDSAPPAR